jgi:Calpain family cysteine protease
MRNPHGATGAEWNGDWSDTCPNWTQRAKKKLGYEPQDHPDGVFWMDAYDFLQ